MMTTNLERQFFDTFGIEKIIPCYKCNMQNTNWDCKRTCLYDDEKRKEYPAITDRILLELICILSQLQAHLNDYYRIIHSNYESLKIQILGDCICEKEFIKQKVQALFKGE